MRPVAIAFAALSALAIPAAAQAAPAGQMFAQGQAPAVGGNGMSGNPEIGPDTKPTYPPTKHTTTTHHRRRHYAARTTTSTPATPSSSTTAPMPDASK
jgi:hypothetical protein